MLLLFIALIVLIILSAFFSGSETGMMSLNRYRLHHRARKGDKKSAEVAALLERPDRLLGVILIGNTFANILSSAIATLIAVHYFGEAGIVVVTILLTLTILIFGETTPKTLAALYPERVAYPAAGPLRILLKILHPLVWLSNTVANAILRLFRVKVTKQKFDPLSTEEIRTLVYEASSKISVNYQTLLLRILDLETVVVEDVMVPRNEIYGINLDDHWDSIMQQIITSHHTHLPVYRDSIENIQGIIDLRNLFMDLSAGTLTKAKLLTLLDPAYLVPEATAVNVQLLNFQQNHIYIGMVIDEYGDIKGLINLKDILEEIVGEFSPDLDSAANMIWQQKDCSYLVDAAINIRDLIRLTKWQLPFSGPKTLSGLIIEELEMIPTRKVCLRLSGYPVEVMRVRDNRIERVRIWPKAFREVKQGF